MEGWDEPQGAPVDLAQMDQMIIKYQNLREEYDNAKKAASEKWTEVEEIQDKIMAALEAAKKKSYKVDGVGTFSVVTKEVVTMPKTIEEKAVLFRHLQEKYGVEVLTSMLTINWQSFNSFYNEEAEKSDDPMFAWPGVAAPTAKKEPRFTRSR